jgi:hypothetical protein
MLMMVTILMTLTTHFRFPSFDFCHYVIHAIILHPATLQLATQILHEAFGCIHLQEMPCPLKSIHLITLVQAQRYERIRAMARNEHLHVQLHNGDMLFREKY